MGRTIEGREDWHAVLDALDAADVRHLAARRYTALSGGEKARVSLARVLAQQTPIVFLDEPTASLDLRHQEDVMRVGRRMADDGPRGRGRRARPLAREPRTPTGSRSSPPAASRPSARRAEVLTEERVERVYGLPVELHLVNDRPVVVPLR